MRAAALNYRDVKERRQPDRPSGPYVPGSDFAGDIVDLGTAVTSIAVGQRVVGIVPHGACAELVATDVSMVVPIPDGLDFAHASTIPVAGLSASFLMSTARLQPDAIVVTHAAAGGLGCYLGGLLRAAGVLTIGLTSTPAKEEVARRAGHNHVVLYPEVDPVAAIHDITDGRGADIVFDSVAGAGFTRSFRMLASEGAVVLCGRSAGEPDLATVTGDLIGVRRNRGLRDFFLQTHLLDHLDQVPERITHLAHALQDATIAVPVAIHPLGDIAATTSSGSSMWASVRCMANATSTTLATIGRWRYE